MLIVKKILTREDFELVERQDPQASSRIYLLNSEEGKSSFFPMTPMDKSDTKILFGLLPKLNATIWEGGYYVGDFSFELKFDGTFDSAASPRKLLTSLVVRINGIDVEKDVNTLVSAIHNGELYDEDLQRELYGAKERFFNTLSRALYEEESPKDAIFNLAVDSLTRFFPCLKVEILFAELNEELTPAEAQYKEAMEKLNAERQQMDLEVKKRQSKSQFSLSMLEIEENEETVKNALTLRRQERELSVRNNELQLRLLNETADDKVELEKARIRKEKAEVELGLKKVENEAAALELKQQHALMENKLQQKRMDEEEQESARRKELHEKLCLIKEAELEKIKLESEEIKARIEAVKNTPASVFVQPAPAAVQVISTPAIEEQSLRVRVLHEDLLNSVAGAKDEELLNMLQMKSGSGNSVKLEKDLSPVKISARGLALEMDFDDQAVRAGDLMWLSFTSSVRGCLTLLCFSTSGEITVLSPNIIDNCVVLEAGVEYSMPGDKLLSRARLRQSGPAGRERIAAIVTAEPLIPALPAGLKGFMELDSAALPGIIAKLEALPPQSWAAGYLGYSVVE